MNSVKLSSDGKRALTSDIYETVLWDVVTGRELRRFQGSGGTFSANGAQVLTGGQENTARLWDVATGREMCRMYGGEGTFSPDGKLAGRRFFDNAMGTFTVKFTGYTETIGSVAFSPDGKKVLTSSSDNTVRVWNLDTCQEMHRFYGGEGKFSPDGKQVLTGSYDNTTGRWDVPASAADKTVRLWDVATGREVRQFIGHADRVNLVAFSSDGRRVLTGSNDNTARLWDAATGQELHRFAGSVRSIAFSSDNKQVLTSSWDNIVRVWDVDADVEKQRFSGFEGMFTPDGKQVVTGGSDKILRLWDVATGREVQHFTGLSDGVASVRVSSDGNQILAGSRDGTVLAWNIASGREVRRFIGLSVEIDAVAFSPDGQRIVAKGQDKKVRLWDAANNGGISRFPSFSNGINSVAFSPDGQQVLTSGSDKTVRLWDTVTGEELRHFSLFTSTVNSAVFSSDGKLVLIGGRDETGGQSHLTIRHGDILIPGGRAATPQWSARLLDVASGQEKVRIKLSAADITAITSVALSADGKRVLTSSSDDKIRLWDATTSEYLTQFYGTDGVFSPDGKQVLCGGGRENYARLADIVPTEQRFEERKRFVGHTNTILAVAFSPDGKRVLTGSNDKTARLWDPATGKQLQLFVGHTGAVRSVAFSPDGKQVLTGSRDSTVRLWDAATGQELCSLLGFRDGSQVVVDASGRFDAADLNHIGGFSWVFADDPFTPLAPEIFVRDYYTPRLLSKILSPKGLSQVTSGRNLGRINRSRPVVAPKIEVTSESDAGDLVTVTVHVRNNQHTFLINGVPTTKPSGIHDVRLFRDGQIVGEEPETALTALEHQVSSINFDPIKLKDWQEKTRLESEPGREVPVQFKHIRLPQTKGLKRVRFSAYAFNEDRVKSDTVSYDHLLKFDTFRTGRAYLVTIGVNSCDAGDQWNLSTPANDARLMREHLPRYLSTTYSEVIPITLVSSRQKPQFKDEIPATKENIRAVFDALSGKVNNPQIPPARPEDFVLIAFSGHGFSSSTSPFYLVPANPGEAFSITDEQVLIAYLNGNEVADPEEVERFVKHCISNDEISYWIRGVDARDIVMVLDACHSGASVGPEDVFRPGPMGDPGFGQLAYDKGMRMLASTQAAGISVGDGNGLLIYALMQHLVTRNSTSLDTKVWLQAAARAVPEIYKAKVPQQIQSQNQEQQPQLFDFKR